MAFCTFHRPDAVNVSARTAEGLKGIYFPLTSPALTERRILINSACQRCTKSSAHGPPAKQLGVCIPFGEARHQRIDAAYPSGEAHIAADSLFELFGTFWLASYIANGVPYDFIWNVGASGDNLSQQIRYEILSVSGARMHLRGRNPKFLAVGTLQESEGWPGSGPPRLTPGSFSTVLMPGSLARFAYPSAQYATNHPYIVSVEPPVSDTLENVDFYVNMSADCENCTEPFDAKFPPGDGKYYVEFFWEATYAPSWPNIQIQFEAQFAVKTETLSKADVAALNGLFGLGANVLPLRTTANADARVIYPEMFDGAFRLWYKREGGAEVEVAAEDITPHLTTTQTAGPAWTSKIDLTSWAFSDLQFVRLTYRPTAESDDDFLLMFAGNCANAQLDRSLSYIHSGGRRCMNVECSQFASFQNECWQPDADKFCLGNETSGFQSENMATPVPSDIFQATWLGLLWNRYSWIFQQGEPGESAVRNFSFSRPAYSGPSVAELLGVFRDRAPAGKFSTKQPLFTPAWGRRVVSHDAEGDHHTTLFGAYISAETQYASGTAILGSLDAVVPGWATKADQFGATFDQRIGCYPSWNPPTVHCYNYGQGTSGIHTTNRAQETGQLYAISVDPTVVDAEVSAEIAARFS